MFFHLFEITFNLCFFFLWYPIPFIMWSAGTKFLDDILLFIASIPAQSDIFLLVSRICFSFYLCYPGGGSMNVQSVLSRQFEKGQQRQTKNEKDTNFCDSNQTNANRGPTSVIIYTQ